MIKKKKVSFLYIFSRLFFIILCLTGLVLFYSNFIANDRLYKNRYPLMYDDIVSEYSKIYEVDKYLVHSVIRTESFFNKDAVSKKGAIGLMQIMPDTGIWIADELNLENFTKEDLFDCEKNIMIGVWYLSYLLNRFDGNIDTALAAYNAGPTNVSKWLLESDLSNDGKNLSSIPFDETRKYQDKVSNAYETYLRLYGIS